MSRLSFGRICLVVDLLPHLDRRDGELRGLRLPGWIPLILAGPEILGRRLRLVYPRLAGIAILEPAIGASNSQIDDEVKLLIKGRVQVGVIDPRVGEGGAVGIGQWELSTCPEILIERIVKDLEKASIYVGEEVFLTPFQAIGVCAGRVSRVEG